MSKSKYIPTKLPPNYDFETINILKSLTNAKSALAELKGYANIIPNQNILINALSLQEAKDSSAVENIITTHDEIFQSELHDKLNINVATKEVQNYKVALQEGMNRVEQASGLIKNDCILKIQEKLEQNKAGYRKLPGTSIINEATGEVVYEPPQSYESIKELMSNLINYINDDELHPIDPLIKMAIIHYQFESIHPFYDGNGRSGRILNILYLSSKKLLNLPILYLSRYIIQNKSQYYEYLQKVRIDGDWEKWILFILEAVKLTAIDTIYLINQIKSLMQEYKSFIRDNFSFYSQDLLNNLFKHPYTKIDFVKNDLKVTRQTASKYLNELANHPSGLVKQVQFGKFTYFINVKLFKLFAEERILK